MVDTRDGYADQVNVEKHLTVLHIQTSITHFDILTKSASLNKSFRIFWSKIRLNKHGIRISFARSGLGFLFSLEHSPNQ